MIPDQRQFQRDDLEKQICEIDEKHASVIEALREYLSIVRELVPDFPRQRRATED